MTLSQFHKNFTLPTLNVYLVNMIVLSPDDCLYGSTSATVIYLNKIVCEVLSDVCLNEAPQRLDMKSTVVLEPHVAFSFSCLTMVSSSLHLV